MSSCREINSARTSTRATHGEGRGTIISSAAGALRGAFSAAGGARWREMLYLRSSWPAACLAASGRSSAPSSALGEALNAWRFDVRDQLSISEISMSNLKYSRKSRIISRDGVARVSPGGREALQSYVGCEHLNLMKRGGFSPKAAIFIEKAHAAGGGGRRPAVRPSKMNRPTRARNAA